MKKFNYLVGGLFLAAASNSFSQTVMTFKECSDAIGHLERFVSAHKDKADAQLFNSQITKSAHKSRQDSLDDFLTNYSLGECMEGVHSDVYSCLYSAPSDLDSCRN